MLAVFSVTQLWAQNGQGSSSQIPGKEDRNFRIPLIGEAAPSFTAESTNGPINFPSDYGRKWKVLFSHPQDFTPVCSSEILELANLQSQFDELGVKIVIVSTDQLDTHIQWKKAMEGINYKDKEPVKIQFPLVEDKSLAISKKYGMIHSSTNSTKAVRGVFIIDPDNIVQGIYFYPMNVGRSTDELVRTITAMEKARSEGVLTPANWKAGNDVMIPYIPKSDSKDDKTLPEGYYNFAWFMIFKKSQ